MFKDIVLEEIYGVLIKRIQDNSFVQGVRHGIHTTFEVIEEMVSKGLTVTKDSIIEYSKQRSIEEAETLLKDLNNLNSTENPETVKGLLDTLKRLKSLNGEEHTDNSEKVTSSTSDGTEPSSAVVVNLFPNNKGKN